MTFCTLPLSHAAGVVAESLSPGELGFTHTAAGKFLRSIERTASAKVSMSRRKSPRIGSRSSSCMKRTEDARRCALGKSPSASAWKRLTCSSSISDPLRVPTISRPTRICNPARGASRSHPSCIQVQWLVGQEDDRVRGKGARPGGSHEGAARSGTSIGPRPFIHLPLCALPVPSSHMFARTGHARIVSTHC